MEGYNSHFDPYYSHLILLSLPYS